MGLHTDQTSFKGSRCLEGKERKDKQTVNASFCNVGNLNNWSEPALTGHSPS